jgi:hypothetical protein
MKMPEPIMDPATTIVASNSPRLRVNPSSPEAELAGLVDGMAVIVL